MTIPAPCPKCGGTKVQLGMKVVLRTNPDGTQVPDTEPTTETCSGCGGTGFSGHLFVM